MTHVQTRHQDLIERRYRQYVGHETRTMTRSSSSMYLVVMYLVVMYLVVSVGGFCFTKVSSSLLSIAFPLGVVGLDGGAVEPNSLMSVWKVPSRVRSF